MSDWRLVLQDSITTEDLRQGCLSLFDRVDSEMDLSQSETNHAVRFLEYSSLHIKYRRSPHNKLLEAIFPNDEPRQRSLTSTLLKLVCHPSDTLRAVALSFLDVSFSQSSREFFPTVAMTGLLPQLFNTLRPHEIPVNGITIEFHRYITSIVNTIFVFCTPEDICRHLGITADSPRAKALIAEFIDPIFQPSFTYLRSLMAPPVCPTDPRFGFTFISNMPQFDPILKNDPSRSNYPEMKHFFGEIHKNMLEELTSMLGLASSSETELCLHSDSTDPETTQLWLTGFVALLDRVNEETQFSDLGMLAVLYFLKHCPEKMQLIPWTADSFGFKMDLSLFNSSKFTTKSLWALYTPSQPHHAAATLKAFQEIRRHHTDLTHLKHIWNVWFPNFIRAVGTSHVPFTFEFIDLHTELMKFLNDQLALIRSYEFPRKRELNDELRRELDKTYHAFFTQT
ncbi:hypothetical protein BLNAU_10298 [Blattamonas nauphoetae]|uniref:Uncharacterized protein n=1 Tax=Blattamonas nauphoetae TaxID=2049346 RepID=A0ABQ9XTK7_9EUKA|nr:hypothetical protein BLNAU_10298 [Blattamonas nauphoetae]